MQNEHPVIEKLLSLQPDTLLSSKDLIKLGICRSESLLSRMRQRGEPPDFIFIPRRTYLYTIPAVIEWLRSCQKARTVSPKEQIEASVQAKV
jgi:hypothetical protein